MELQNLKNKAAEAFAKGKFNRAAELYDEYCQKDPRDLQARIRMGDAWARTGNREKAIGAYQSAAEGFAKNGFFPRAIAASKLILELDPLHKGVQQMLAGLYAQKGGPSAALGTGPSTELGTGPSTGVGTGPSMELGTGPSTELGTGPSTELGTGPSTGVGTGPSMELGATLPPSTSASSRGSRTTVIVSGRTQTLPDGHAPGFASGDRGALELPSVDSEELPLVRNAVSLDPEKPKPRPVEQSSMTATPPGPSAGAALSSRKAEPAAAAVDSADRARSSPAALPTASPGEPPTEKSEPAAASSDDVALEVELSSPPEAFTELELDGDSLLHAVERAARLGAAARAKSSDPRALAAYASLAVAPAERRDKLPVVPLFSDLTPEAFIELFERGPLLRFKKGQRVFEQGSIGRSRRSRRKRQR